MKAIVWVGKKVMVFDPRLWDANGGDSPTDDFYREATVLKIYRSKRSEMADVRFTYDGKISYSHFTDMMEECPKGGGK